MVEAKVNCFLSYKLINHAYMNTIKPILKSVLFFLIGMALISAKMSSTTKINKYKSIDSLTLAGKLKTTIKSLGGHQENCIEFDIKNMTPDTQFIQIEAGRVLTAEDSSLQNIFLVKRKTIDLTPYASAKVEGYGFCCKSHNSSPYKDAKFNIGYMAPPDWVKLAEVIDKNKFPVDAIQSAVWVLSNNHPISSIRDDNMASIDLLRKTVSDIKGIEVPWYSIIYEKDTARLFSDRPERITAEIEYYMRNDGMLTINIRDKKGKIIKTLVSESMQGPGKHIYNLNMKVKGWPRGEYDIYFYNDFSNLNLKKSFKL